MISKDKIERKHLKRNIMKTVIFRIDYQGVTEVEDLVEPFKEKFDGYFKSYITTFHNRVDLELNKIEEISELLAIPIKEIERQIIHRFSQNQFGSDLATLDISKYFTTLSINCTEYHLIDEYLKFFSELTDFFFSINSYLKIKRIGLRKIGGDIFFGLDEIFKSFEKKYFNFDFEETHFNATKNRYYDELRGDSKSPIINYARSFETGKWTDVKELKEKPAFQVILDIDAYYNIELLESLNFGKGMIFDLLQETNNTYLFELFKMSVTKEFLNEYTDG